MIGIFNTAEGASVDFICHGSEKNPNFVFYGLADSDALTLTCSSGEFRAVGIFGEEETVSAAEVRSMTCKRRNEPEIIRTPGSGCSAEGTDKRR